MKKYNYIIIALFVAVAFAVIFWFAGNILLSKSIIITLDNAGIVGGFFLSIASLFFAIYAWTRKQDIRRFFQRRKFENVGEPVDLLEKDFIAAIIPVSPSVIQQPIWIMKWVKPEYVSLLYTDESRHNAQELVKMFSSSEHIQFYPNFDEIEKRKLQISDPDKPEEVKHIVRDMLQHYLDNGIPKNNICVDITAGKVPTSVGAFQMAEEYDVSSIYIVGTKNGHIKDGENRQDGHPVFISNHTPS